MLSAALLLAGCAPSHPKKSPGPPPSVEVGTPRIDDTRVAIPSSTGCAKDACRHGYADPAKWPAACSFIGQDELRSMFPQALKFSVYSAEIRYAGGPQGGKIGVVPKARCGIVFDFQHGHVDADGFPTDYGMGISLSVFRVGAAQRIRKDFETERKVPGQTTVRHDLGPSECFVEGPGWTCREQHIIFMVTIAYHGQPGRQQPAVTLKIAGRPPRTVNLAQQPDTPAVQQIGSDLVRIVAAKIH